MVFNFFMQSLKKIINTIYGNIYILGRRYVESCEN